MEFKNGYNFLYQKAKAIYASKLGRPSVDDEEVDTGLTDEEKKNIKLVYETKDSIIVNFTGIPTTEDTPIVLTAGGEPVVGPSGEDPGQVMVPFEVGQRVSGFYFGNVKNGDINEELEALLLALPTEGDEHIFVAGITDPEVGILIAMHFIDPDLDAGFVGYMQDGSGAPTILYSTFEGEFEGGIYLNRGYNNLTDGKFMCSAFPVQYVSYGIEDTSWNGKLIGAILDGPGPATKIYPFRINDKIPDGAIIHFDLSKEADLKAVLENLDYTRGGTQESRPVYMVDTSDFLITAIPLSIVGQEGYCLCVEDDDNIAYSTKAFSVPGFGDFTEGFQDWLKAAGGNYALHYGCDKVEYLYTDTVKPWNGIIFGTLEQYEPEDDEPDDGSSSIPTPVITLNQFQVGDQFHGGDVIRFDLNKEAELAAYINSLSTSDASYFGDNTWSLVANGSDEPQVFMAIDFGGDLQGNGRGIIDMDFNVLFATESGTCIDFEQNTVSYGYGFQNSLINTNGDYTVSPGMVENRAIETIFDTDPATWNGIIIGYYPTDNPIEPSDGGSSSSSSSSGDDSSSSSSSYPSNYEVTVNSVSNTTIYGDGKYEPGSEVTVSIEADPGYVFEEEPTATLNGNYLTVNYEAGGVYGATFIVNGDCYVEFSASVVDNQPDDDQGICSGNWTIYERFETPEGIFNVNGYVTLNGNYYYFDQIALGYNWDENDNELYKYTDAFTVLEHGSRALTTEGYDNFGSLTFTITRGTDINNNTLYNWLSDTPYTEDDEPDEPEEPEEEYNCADTWTLSYDFSAGDSYGVFSVNGSAEMDYGSSSTYTNNFTKLLIGYSWDDKEDRYYSYAGHIVGLYENEKGDISQEFNYASSEGTLTLAISDGDDVYNESLYNWLMANS